MRGGHTFKKSNRTSNSHLKIGSGDKPVPVHSGFIPDDSCDVPVLVILLYYLKLRQM